MVDFWLDTDMLITARRRYYAPDLAPSFWDFMDSQVEGGRIRAPMRVYEELIDYGDELSKWAKERKDTATTTWDMLRELGFRFG